MSGVARTSVPDPNAYHEPNEPLTSARAARATSNPSAARVTAVPTMIAIASPGATQRARRAAPFNGADRAKRHAVSRSRVRARRRIAAMPATGPSASIGNAHRHPTTPTTGGTSWMDTIVSKKPSDVCTVSAVPTACGGTASVTSVLNCAESAITKNPHVQRERRQQPERMAERGRHQNGARAAQRHRDHHEALTPARVRLEAAPHASEPADRDRAERDQRREFGRHRSLLGDETRSDEGRDPRPERVQLEHVSEIAACREAPLAPRRKPSPRGSTKTVAARTDTVRPYSRVPTSNAATIAQAEAVSTTAAGPAFGIACTRYGVALPTVSAPTTVPIARPAS